MRIIFFLLLLFQFCHAYYKGISFYGLETESRNFVCSWVSHFDYYLQHLHSLGFNFLRLPFSYQWVQEGDFTKMDEIIGSAWYWNMSVVLDMHRIQSSHQSWSPEDGITLNDFIQKGWLPMLDRYSNWPNVIMHNIYNEFQGGSEHTAYLVDYSIKVMDAIEARYPNRFWHAITGFSWSGNISGVEIEHLPYSDLIKYSLHKYAFSGTADEDDWNWSFGNLSPDHIIIGEFGFLKKDEDWAKRFIAYLRKRHIQSAAFWTIAHSHDTDGLWKDDCITFDWDKYNVLNRLWDPL